MPGVAARAMEGEAMGAVVLILAAAPGVDVALIVAMMQEAAGLAVVASLALVGAVTRAAGTAVSEATFPRLGELLAVLAVHRPLVVAGDLPSPAVLLSPVVRVPPMLLGQYTGVEANRRPNLELVILALQGMVPIPRPGTHISLTRGKMGSSNRAIRNVSGRILPRGLSALFVLRDITPVSAHFFAALSRRLHIVPRRRMVLASSRFKQQGAIRLSILFSPRFLPWFLWLLGRCPPNLFNLN